jgi:hypothetical protein
VPKPDDLTDALIDKLAAISPKWRETFPATPGGYRKLQRLINTYGSGNLRMALQFALEAKIVPHDATAFPVLQGILKRRMKIEDVETSKGML